MTDLYRLTPDELRPFAKIKDFNEPTAEDVAALGPEAKRLWLRVHQANGSEGPDEIDEALRLEPGIDGNYVVAELLARRGDANGAIVTTAGRFRALGLSELRKRPKPSYTIDRLLQADTVAVLEGIDGTYKSFLALAWAHCVALGRPWLGWPVQQGRVLYLLGEGSRGLPRRADAWQIVNLGQREDLEGNLGFVVDEMPQLWKGDASEVLAANPGLYALIVVDTLARAMVGGNENLQQDMGMLVAGCEDLRRGTGGATVLILHHLNGAGGTRGSTALPGAISTRLRLERHGTSRLVTLHVRKQRDDEPEQPTTLIARTVDLGTLDDQERAETSLVLELAPAGVEGAGGAGGAGAVPAPKLTPAASKALATLVELGEATFAGWQQATGEPPMADATFKRARRDLLAEGLIEQIQDRYRPTELGNDKGAGGAMAPRLALSDPSAKEEGPGGATRLTSVAPGPFSPAPPAEEPWV